MARATDITSLGTAVTNLGTELTRVDTAIDNIRGYAATNSAAGASWASDVDVLMSSVRAAAQAIVDRTLVGPARDA